MLNNKQSIDLEKELPDIPAEYQDIFRQTLEQELAESGQDQTDTDILAYLRRRRDDFQQGGFIRPDGRSGAMTLSPEAIYEQALPQLAKSSRGMADDAAERRQTFLKIGALVLVAVVFFLFASRSRSQSNRVQDTPVAEVADGPSTEGRPTPPLPALGGAEDSLQTIGALGGALTIGRPSALEIHYKRTEETIALAIDPSKPTPKGELRYNEVTMLSDTPVAVWLFGTVLNYAIGIPDSLVRNLAAGDRIALSTDTGASLRFVVTETGQGASYETGRLLSQNRLGLTLFALPAPAEDAVAFALASYDLSGEEARESLVYEMGDRIPLGDSGELQITAVQVDQTNTGSVRIGVSGVVTGETNSDALMLSLSSRSEQTTAVPLTPDATGNWQTTFTLPETVTGQPLLAEIRSVSGTPLAVGGSGGGPVVVQLGPIPDLLALLQVEVTAAWRDSEQTNMTAVLAVHNPGEGAVYLDSEFIQTVDELAEGGDAYEGRVQVEPRLPLLVDPGETLGLTVTFPWRAEPVRLQIGADLWEITD